MTPSLAINYTDGFTPACLHSHNANRNVLLFCFTNKTGSCTKTMTVSQILTEMQLCKLWGWRICACEEMQPYRTPLHLGNAHRGQTWHSLAYSSGALLWCASQRTIFTQKYIKVSRLKRRQIPLWVRFPDSANCFQLPPSLTPVLSWPLRKHAVDYHRIGNPPEEFPANCILLDKGNGLRKFGLGRKTRLEEQSELSDALSSPVPLPCWMETTASSGWGRCLCFPEADLHKAPEPHSYRKLDSLYRCPWTSLNLCGQMSFSGFSCPSGRNYHTSCLPLPAWQWLLPAGSIPYPLW